MPEEDEKYQIIAADALQEILKYCPYVEMNTGAISRGWRKVPYLNAQLLDVMKRNGGEVVLGSDSHHRDNLTFFFDECVEILKNNGIDHISVFNGDGFDKMGI
jgi:histidinol-phosphatase (PHP family)